MEPSRTDIADLFSVVYDKPTHIEPYVSKSKGDDAEESAQLGAQSLTEGNIDKAIEHFRRAMAQRDPEDIRGRIDLGGAYEFAGMAPEALRQYELALRIRRDAPEPLFGLSQLYKRNARYRDSLKPLEEALKLQPNNPFYLFKMAEIHREVGDLEGALAPARLAAVYAPTDSFYCYWVGDLLIEMGRFDEALESFRTALDLSPGDDFLYLRAASAFWGAGRRQEAVKSVRLASDLDPDKDLYHGLLEVLLRNMELFEEAGLEARRAAQMDSYDREALRRIVLELRLQA